MSRIACALTAALLVLWCLPAQAKPPAGITIDVDLGYNGWVQPGRVNPVTVDMENASADLNLSGDLVLEYDGVEYVTRLELPTPSRKRFHLYFPCGAYPPVLVLRVRTKAYTEEFQLDTYRRTLEPADANILVLTSQSGSLGALSRLPGVRIHRDLYNSRAPDLGTSRSFVAYYDVADLEPNPKFFARADTIVLGDVDYQQVTPELAEAIKARVSGGASLIFSLGLNGAAVAASPLGELCPLKARGTVQTTDLGSFGSHYGISAQGAPATLAVGALDDGAQVAEWAGEYPVVVRQLRGSGRVTALAFDFTTQPFKQDEALAPVFIDSALRVEDSVHVTDWFVHPHSVSSVLLGLSEATPMAPWFVLLFLAAYIVLVGPANFIILGRLKRRTLVWTTIPLLIVGFSYLGLSTGYFYRGGDSVAAYFQELHIYPGADYIPYQATMLLFTAERMRVEVEVPDESAFFYPDVPVVYDEYGFGRGGGRLQGFGSGRIDNSKQPLLTTTQSKWQPKDYFYRGYYRLPAKVQAQLTATYRAAQPDIEGTFSLDLPFDLYDSRVYSPGGGNQRLGDLAGLGTYQLQGNQTAVSGRLDPENYLVASREELRAALAQSIRLGHSYRDEVLLVGFTEQVDVLAEFKRPHIEHNLTMVVVHLPFESVVATEGQPRVVRTRLVGGAGFAAFERDRFSGSGAAGQPYSLAADGFLDVSYTVAGRIGGRSILKLSLLGQSSQDQQPLGDFSSVMEVEAWDGQRWRSVRVPPNETALELPLGSLLGQDRSVTVRFHARGDFVLGTPVGDAW